MVTPGAARLFARTPVLLVCGGTGKSPPLVAPLRCEQLGQALLQELNRSGYRRLSPRE